MARFLTTRAALSEIEGIIDSATEQIVILSPFIGLAPAFVERLRAADRRDVPITLVYGKREMSAEEALPLSGLKNLRRLFSRPLHAKCYYNESRMVITSLNFLQSSEQNWEMGVLLDRDEEAFAAAVREVDLVINSAAARDLGLEGGSSTVLRLESAGRGHCIRCSRPVDLDPDRPFCIECFSVWVQWDNWEWQEVVCHQCGRPASTSRARPLCTPCFTSGSGSKWPSARL